VNARGRLRLPPLTSATFISAPWGGAARHRRRAKDRRPTIGKKVTLAAQWKSVLAGRAEAQTGWGVGTQAEHEQKGLPPHGTSPFGTPV
jgi:hypothetical protein